MFASELDQLLSCLDLERIETNLFRGVSRDIGAPQVFGGQVLGQALVAASRTVDGRLVHSVRREMGRQLARQRPTDADLVIGVPDSAIAAYESVATVRAYLNEGRDLDLPIIYPRLGELYETKGDKAKALEYYGKFVDLWKDADPELQPRVAEIRKRIGQLAGEPGAR